MVVLSSTRQIKPNDSGVGGLLRLERHACRLACFPNARNAGAVLLDNAGLIERFGDQRVARVELVGFSGEAFLGRVSLGKEPRAYDLDEVLEYVDLYRRARGVVAVAQRVGKRLADRLGRHLWHLLAVHAGLADDYLVADVPGDEALGEVEQRRGRSLFAVDVDELGCTLDCLGCVANVISVLGRVAICEGIELYSSKS